MRATPCATKASLRIPSGRIHYVEQGTGPVALFVHGVLLNSHLWRHQLAQLSDIRRCIAIDLLAHGETEIDPAQDVSVTANAHMLREFLDALGVSEVDLIGNDSGGGIAQIFAALNPQRVRSLTLTDCDAHDNWPPEAFKGFLEMAAAGGLRAALEAMLANKEVYRSPGALGPAYEHVERVTDEDIDTYLRPLLASEQRTRDFQRFLAAFDCAHTLNIESRLKTLAAPTLIVWGTDDVYFDVKWSRWLADTIPGTRKRVEYPGARLFFPEERWEAFNRELREHWTVSAPMQTREFRSLHNSGLLVLPNAWDGGSARLIESCGAQAIATTSAGLAWAAGYADGGDLPGEVLLDAVRAIARVIRVPLTVDIEGGYSHQPEAVARLVTAIMDAGAVGINIEDGADPPELLCDKIIAVRQGAAGLAAELFINVRTDVYLRALAARGGAVAEVIRRANLYRAAGCDGLFVPGLSDPSEIKAIAAAIDPVPLNVMLIPGLPPVEVLRSLGVRRLSAGSALAQAALGRLAALTRDLLQGRVEAIFDESAEYGRMNQLLQVRPSPGVKG
jgi:2-methylisocitrate lyase-like PEP mutase family enzyme